MIKVNTIIKLYSYDELKDKAKERAFNEHKDFLDSCEEESENEQGELIKEYVDHDEEIVEDSLRINEYLFFKDGEMADICIFTGKHEKTGTTEFYFNGETYIIK